MFTGLVQDVGTIRSVSPRGSAKVLVIESTFTDLVLGESVACDGVCLTVEASEPGAFQVAAGEETIRMTTCGGRAPGSRVHLERALRLSDRLGGHIVQGHVDTIAKVVSVARGPQFMRIDVQLPAAHVRHVVPKGSICIDGVSLTVNGIDGDTFWVGIVPHTLEVTKMGALRPGDRVNIEVDLLAKYVERLLGGEGVSWATLQAAGFIRE
jgi:riboflavin synthase